MNLIDKIETERVFIRNIELSEAGTFQAIHDETHFMHDWDGHYETEKDYMKNCIQNGDLPPGGIKENFQAKGIFDKEGNILGILMLYYGYPQENILYIPLFFLRKEHHGKGYGREIIDELTLSAEKTGYKTLRLGVAAKNWGGIKFWFKMGFDKITKISGDSEIAQDKFMTIELEKHI